MGDGIWVWVPNRRSSNDGGCLIFILIPLVIIGGLFFGFLRPKYEFASSSDRGLNKYYYYIEYQKWIFSDSVYGIVHFDLVNDFGIIYDGYFKGKIENDKIRCTVHQKDDSSKPFKELEINLINDSTISINGKEFFGEKDWMSVPWNINTNDENYY